VNLPTSAWFAGGSILGDAIEWRIRRRGGSGLGLPSDMSFVSLLGGGLIAGDAIAALGIGMYGLIGTLAGG
jgi:hypothetical protein